VGPTRRKAAFFGRSEHEHQAAAPPSTAAVTPEPEMRCADCWRFVGLALVTVKSKWKHGTGRTSSSPCRTSCCGMKK